VRGGEENQNRLDAFSFHRIGFEMDLSALDALENAERQDTGGGEWDIRAALVRGLALLPLLPVLAALTLRT
jgi:hypothetical protein